MGRLRGGTPRPENRMKVTATLLLAATLSLQAGALDMKIRSNPHLIDFLPSDLTASDVRLANKVSTMRECANAGGQTGSCISYCSDSDYACWVVRYLPTGIADRIYSVNGTSIELWLQVDPKNSNKVLFMSDRARNFAAEKTSAMLKEPPRSRAQGCEPYSGADRARCDRLGPRAMRVAPTRDQHRCPKNYSWQETSGGPGRPNYMSCLRNVGPNE